MQTYFKDLCSHDTTAFTFYFKNRHLGNFPDTQKFGKFPKYIQIFEGGIFLRFWKFLEWLEISNKPRHLGNSPNVWVIGTFLKCLGIWGFPQMPWYLGNFQSFEKICKISQGLSLVSKKNPWFIRGSKKDQNLYSFFVWALTLKV